MFDGNTFRGFAALLLWTASAGAARLCVEVTDPARLPLPRVLIQIQNLHDSMESKSARTDDAGKACVDLPEGVYALEVQNGCRTGASPGIPRTSEPIPPLHCF